MAENKPLRTQVVELFKAGLGEPEIVQVESGEIYRWTLERGRGYINMYISIDSPEHTEIAHVLVSDGSEYQVEPLVNITIYTMDQAQELLNRIIRQWKSFRQKADDPPSPT